MRITFLSLLTLGIAVSIIAPADRAAANEPAVDSGLERNRDEPEAANVAVGSTNITVTVPSQKATFKELTFTKKTDTASPGVQLTSR